MYIPAYFEPDPAAVTDLLNHHGAGDLITMTEAGLLATMLPFLFDPPASRPDAGPLGALVGHVARNNGQWRAPAQGLSLAILRGPDAYISPSWYETKREHGRVVPTWNYLTAHVYGELVIHDDVAWLEALVRRLTDKHESNRPRRWSVDDAPAAYVAGQLKAIVGIELRIERIEAKAKLSQNRSEADIDGVIAGLDETGRDDLAQAMRKARR
ncbi:MAG TPA: FMN-binding negative transcriptional regulator [Candidatus Limnocylindrales bacterium]|jgi:transcriptional regulator